MQLLHAGLDIGSTTVKAVILDEEDRMIFSRYMRHFADIKTTAKKIVDDIRKNFLGTDFTISVAGSGALDLARGMDVPFTQEQIACSRSIGRFLPGVDVSIELGGEDAKLTFFDSSGADQRMNETCAGGTGAFLDQMAALLGIDVNGLNELAKNYQTIYPIASRCGVFAKTDVQALLNDGASRADIAASIFQAIVDQTISGLACGRRIKGKVAFLGGPLYFMPELRKRFAETLKLTPDECIVPENPHLFVAIGAAISAKGGSAMNMDDIGERAHRYFVSQHTAVTSALPPLFKDEAEREEFRKRHALGRVKRAELKDYRGGAYLGIDVGSTTTKAVLAGSDGQLLYSRYVLGAGKPVTTVREILSEIYSLLPDGVTINSSAVTGYGEKLIQTAYGVDIGEVETVAHSRAAEFFLPGVDFVIDIGGQDMKCLGISGGVIDKVFLNEACSSGCGSFLQSFAESLHMGVADFAKEAERSQSPVDLGSRCTVFMNSRVRQAQKDGASISDISAGLVYSIVRNALYKVLKIKNADELGKNIVVQGGTFKNDALLRAFELLTGRNVVRPDIPELMGAFGAALLARDRWNGRVGSLVSADKLKDFSAEANTFRCRGCGNACILTRTKFSDGRSYISGNRCAKGGGGAVKKDLPPNVYAQKYRRLFGYYEPLAADAAVRGTVGIPRVLNMYEDYPFWFTFFTKLGFRVELSSERPDKNFGIDTIPSQTVCYPAKLVHRHIVDLLVRGVKRIFYPTLMTEKKEFADAKKNFNCPVVIGYPDVARLNIDGLREPGVTFMHPDVNIESAGQIVYAMEEALEDFHVSRKELREAAEEAQAAQKKFRDDVAEMGRAALDYMTEHGTVGIILAGHPYHLDPEVNHGIPELINEYGVTLFTEDSVCGMGSMGKDGVGVLDQWVFHSRLYRAAMAAATDPRFKNTELVQIDSFGCGLDAISSGQTAELLERYGKLYTMIKVDEGSNNGAVRIRVRSLLAAINAGKSRRAAKDEKTPAKTDMPEPGTQGRTLLCPPLSMHQFQFIETAFKCGGYDLRLLPEGGRECAELGLRYVNNDMCYPAAIVIGQFLKALQSGEYDPNTTDCLYAQTGGICRASNYVRLMRMALDAAGFKQVRVVAINAQNDGAAVPLKIPAKVMWRAALAMLYGDLMMRLSLRTRPYELSKGDTDSLYEQWKERVKADVRDGGWHLFKSEVKTMVRDFAAVPISSQQKPRVGVVGEILVKYHAGANEHIVDTIEREGGEAYVPDLSNFLLYCMHDPIYKNRSLGGAFMPALLGKAGIRALEFLRAPVKKAIAGTRFGEIHSIESMAEKSKGIVSQSNQGGEGWLLTAEMAAMIESGVKNILCIQPFSCLPDHITGKGVIKELKRRYENVNILALDFDASVSAVNQLNRIKLLMATSRV
jgi:predicted CoA-substrate-specific enzyme activase